MPIAAWPGGVFEFEMSTFAFENQAPWSIIRRRNGQSSGHSSSTFTPDESQTSVTTSFGSSRSLAGRRASVSARPSGDSYGNFTSAAEVGAMSTSPAGFG